MDQVFFGLVIGLVMALIAWLLLSSGGDPQRRQLARRVRDDPELADKVAALLEPPPPPKPSGAPLRLLALLQREGRLLDFLLENLQACSDQQIASAVRDIQGKCQKALQEHLVLEPVLPQAEQATVEVPPGFDPSAIRLTGNVTGQPPFRGTLQHHGWRVKEIKLAPLPDGSDEFVVHPAEVELP